MTQRTRNSTPRIVFEQPYGVHDPALAKLLSDVDAATKNAEEAQKDRSKDPNE